LSINASLRTYKAGPDIYLLTFIDPEKYTLPCGGVQPFKLPCGERQGTLNTLACSKELRNRSNRLFKIQK